MDQRVAKTATHPLSKDNDQTAAQTNALLEFEARNSAGFPYFAVRDKLAKQLFGKKSLDRKLKRQHITGIAFSGTVGIGLFITSGELIGIAGSFGVVLSFIGAGFIIISVMRCLAEMVSVRPLSGALIDYPHTFVDEALGFATGVIYWLAQCLSMATLTAAAARVANNFCPEHPLKKSQTAGLLVGLLAITLLSNTCGVRIYGNIERVVKWVKILVLLSLCVLMALVNAGVGHYGEAADHRWRNLTDYTLTPGWSPSGFPVDPTAQALESAFGRDAGVPGVTGRFLAVWTAITFAAFPCMGGDIVIVAAGEAMHPRKDLPPSARFMYLVPIGFYILASFLVGLNINYNNPNLFRPWIKLTRLRFDSNSPFIIVLKDTSLAPNVLPTVFSALFLFCAYTAANTALFVSSRTLFALVQKYGSGVLERTIGRTNSGNTPLAAIFVSSLFGCLAFLGLSDSSFNQPVLSMSAFFTGAIACVYITECIAYLRFKWGLTQMGKRLMLSRDDEEYKQKYYRPHWQPFWAYTGLVGCTLIMVFSGWPAIYILRQRRYLATGAELKPDHLLAWDLAGAYAGPILFLILYLGYKLAYQTKIRTYDYIRRQYAGYELESFDEDPCGGRAPTTQGWRYWIPEVWSFVK